MMVPEPRVHFLFPADPSARPVAECASATHRLAEFNNGRPPSGQIQQCFSHSQAMAQHKFLVLLSRVENFPDCLLKFPVLSQNFPCSDFREFGWKAPKSLASQAC